MHYAYRVHELNKEIPANVFESLDRLEERTTGQ